MYTANEISESVQHKN